MISVYDSFFRNYISMVLLSFIVLTRAHVHIGTCMHGDPLHLFKSSQTIALAHKRGGL